MSTIWTRMGDGAAVEMTAEEVRADMVAGSEDAAKKGKIPTLEKHEYDYLFEMFASPTRIWGVERGHEAILTKDGSTNSLYSAQLSSGVGLPLSREQCFRTFERAFSFDTMEIGHTDYSVKPVKPIVALEQTHVEAVLHNCIIPVYYGFMPNLGLYFRPDGPFPNPSDLLPKGQIAEARAATEEGLEACRTDMIWMTDKMDEVGADGINYDTTASTGDGEFLAVLEAVEHAVKNTDLSVEVGMAAECVLGFHGQLTYDGKRLAGMWPHQQLEVVEKAGTHVFGPVVNTNSRRSTPWNLARAVTFVKAVTERASIPIHPNVGMGVGGVPMFECPPPDVVTRCSAAMIMIGKADGLQVGTGDPTGMSLAHALASSMGGIRTAGDLVARMQMTRKMRLPEAKRHVAGKLGVSVTDLSDSTVMRRVREDLDIGLVTGVAGAAKGLEAKARIATLLDVKINCVERLKDKMHVQVD